MILDCYDFYLWSVGVLRVPPDLSEQLQKHIIERINEYGY